MRNSWNPPSPFVEQNIFVIFKRTHWPAIWNRRVARGKPNGMLQRSTMGPLCNHWIWCCNVDKFARQVESRIMQACMRNILTRLNFDNLYSNSAHLTGWICGGGRKLERPVKRFRYVRVFTGFSKSVLKWFGAHRVGATCIAIPERRKKCRSSFKNLGF